MPLRAIMNLPKPTGSWAAGRKRIPMPAKPCLLCRTPLRLTPCWEISCCASRMLRALSTSIMNTYVSSHLAQWPLLCVQSSKNSRRLCTLNLSEVGLRGHVLFAEKSIFCRRQTRFEPALPTAVHRFDVVVAHLLQIFTHKPGSKSPPALQNELRVRVRNPLLDVAFDTAPAQVNGAGNMPVGPFAVLAHIHEQKLLPRVPAALHIGNVGFLDFLFRFVHQL